MEVELLTGGDRAGFHTPGAMCVAPAQDSKSTAGRSIGGVIGRLRCRRSDVTLDLRCWYFAARGFKSDRDLGFCKR
jgi:hypothetical protein